MDLFRKLGEAYRKAHNYKRLENEEFELDIKYLKIEVPVSEDLGDLGLAKRQRIEHFKKRGEINREMESIRPSGFLESFAFNLGYFWSR